MTVKTVTVSKNLNCHAAHQLQAAFSGLILNTQAYSMHYLTIEQPNRFCYFAIHGLGQKKPP